MTARRDPPPDTVAKQALASDPANSAWVSANAGSGKTHVLAQRVIRLLLSGAEPSRILCLTYTRAAASVMANRVFRDLGAWTALDNGRLAARIAEIEGRMPDRAAIARARSLFAIALETPGGLKVQTIHAFCEAILHKFPLEANIAGHFELVDPRMEELMFAEARRATLAGAAAETLTLAEAFATILARAGEKGLDDLLREIVARRDAMRGFIDRVSDDQLLAAFGFTPAGDEASIGGAAWPVPGFSGSELARLVKSAERHQAAKALDIFGKALKAMQAPDPLQRLAMMCAAFLTAKGDVRKTDKLFKQAFVNEAPDIVDRYVAAAEHLIAVADRLATFRMCVATNAVRTLADAVIGRYERQKAARGLLDFNDLIARTVNLLSRSDAAPWVQYKLDQGIDHILIDEAQDTSPPQWEVVRALAGDFFAGAGARGGRPRSVFAVGDEKQSIYSFQGADPAEFGMTKGALSLAARGAEAAFEDIRLTLSFRSTEDVLSAVDIVFANEAARDGLTVGKETIEHASNRPGEPGVVEVWQSVGAVNVEEPEDWTEPVDEASAPAVRVASRVAKRIKDLVDAHEARPGDIMVLVRKRDRFVHALSRALKEYRVPVAGADRLTLSAHIAVQDMMALARFCLMPEDDLSLAALLRSPVFGLSEDDLFRLAHYRPEGGSLWRSLRGEVVFTAITERLEQWMNEAAYRPVFEFFAGVLGPGKVRAAMVARLGEDAGDILDEFLGFCLAEERIGLPGLDSFLATLETAAPEIKREMDAARNEVRIMTVHAAKGAEAPVVFLVDAGGAPFVDQHLPRLMPTDLTVDGVKVPGLLWRAGADTANRALDALARVARLKAEQEYRRLLYVGMTRAADRLFVCGYHGRKPPRDTTWLSIVSDALRAAPGTTMRHDDGWGEVLIHRVTSAPLVAATHAPAPLEAGEPFPEALLSPLPPAPDLPRPLAPSGASLLIEEDREPVISTQSPVFDARADPPFAIARGLAVHRLLQSLPGLPENQREPAAARYLGAVGADWPAAACDAALRSVLGVLSDPRLAAVFGEGSRAEVELMGMVTVRGRERAVSGKVDRLAVTPERVLVVDFKTDRIAPASDGQVAEAYVLQMALYRTLLARIFADRPVEAALVFTEGPSVVPLPAALMDGALARLSLP
ncbi:MAG: double-strand break repair helicase AddA [Rhizobiaceae bacterium]